MMGYNNIQMIKQFYIIDKYSVYGKSWSLFWEIIRYCCSRFTSYRDLQWTGDFSVDFSTVEGAMTQNVVAVAQNDGGSARFSLITGGLVQTQKADGKGGGYSESLCLDQIGPVGADGSWKW